MTDGPNGPLCPRVCTDDELVNSIRDEVVAELAARPDVKYIEEQAGLELMATVVSEYPAGVDLFAQVDRIERTISDGVLLRLSSFTGRSNVPRELLPKVLYMSDGLGISYFYVFFFSFFWCRSNMC